MRRVGVGAAERRDEEGVGRTSAAGGASSNNQMKGVDNITPEAARQHVLKIGGEPNIPPAQWIHERQDPIDETLAELPTEEEIWKEAANMKVIMPSHHFEIIFY